jgi:hypothetical protein
VKILSFFFAGRPGVAGAARWEFHLWMLIALLLAKAVAEGLDSVGRLLAVQGQRVPGYIAAADTISGALFWPTAFLFLYLLSAVVPVRIIRSRG